MNAIHTNFYKIPNKVFELGLSSNEFLVLTYLLSLSNFEIIHPSKQTIAFKTKLSKRTVDRAVNSLVKRGFLEYKRGYGFGTKRVCNQYRIILRKIDPKCMKEQEDLSNSLCENGNQFSEIFEQLSDDRNKI